MMNEIKQRYAPEAVIAFGLTLTLVWAGTLGYVLFKLVELAL
jgi:hypothetical protein